MHDVEIEIGEGPEPPVHKGPVQMGVFLFLVAGIVYSIKCEELCLKGLH